MAQLTKGLYGHQFERASNLFGLSCGQIRGKDFVHNGGWYNKLGEKLGWGDLSTDDFFRIRRELEEGEMFIILDESDSFWNFVTRPGLLGHNAVTKPDVEAPGVDYVAAHARYIITKLPENGFGMYVVDDYPRKEDWVNLDGLMFHSMKREDAKAFITSTAVAPVASES
jgi:hypothetical protein